MRIGQLLAISVASMSFLGACGQRSDGNALATLQADRDQNEASIGPKATNSPPGKLCTTDDRDFTEFRYAERIAYCRRRVSNSVKDQVAALYGVPKSDYHLYQFDHYLPLCAGGANAIDNLWPEPLSDAHEKDKLEAEVCRAMRNASMTQAEAVAKIQDRLASSAKIGKLIFLATRRI